jgi:hypothetical protein
MASHSAFRQLDDLVLDLKGLVLVRKLRERSGAEPAELAMYGAEIERVRERLAAFVKDGNASRAAA